MVIDDEKERCISIYICLCMSTYVRFTLRDLEQGHVCLFFLFLLDAIPVVLRVDHFHGCRHIHIGRPAELCWCFVADNVWAKHLLGFSPKGFVPSNMERTYSQVDS